MAISAFGTDRGIYAVLDVVLPQTGETELLIGYKLVPFGDRQRIVLFALRKGVSVLLVELTV